MELEISLKQSLEKNAAAYFEKAKKAKQKLEGAKEALAESEAKLKQLERKREIEAKESEKVERKRHWYEKFRWFYSSEAELVILGRDATTNEILIKKHTDKTDIVFHIEGMKGPFCVVKGKHEATIQEAANATGSFSEAWKHGLAAVQVFSVKAEQVSKQAQSGEYLSKGMFMIYGKKQFMQAKVALAMGLKDGVPMCGPPEAVAANSKKMVKLFPGKAKASEVGKKIRHTLGGGELDDIIRALPSGGSTLK